MVEGKTCFQTEDWQSHEQILDIEKLLEGSVSALENWLPSFWHKSHKVEKMNSVTFYLSIKQKSFLSKGGASLLIEITYISVELSHC